MVLSQVAETGRPAQRPLTLTNVGTAVTLTQPVPTLPEVSEVVTELLVAPLIFGARIVIPVTVCPPIFVKITVTFSWPGSEVEVLAESIDKDGVHFT